MGFDKMDKEAKELVELILITHENQNTSKELLEKALKRIDDLEKKLESVEEAKTVKLTPARRSPATRYVPTHLNDRDDFKCDRP
jgi:predicted RND superfamily exporter protein